jgi:hypothetical protein
VRDWGHAGTGVGFRSTGWGALGFIGEKQASPPSDPTRALRRLPSDFSIPPLSAIRRIADVEPDPPHCRLRPKRAHRYSGRFRSPPVDAVARASHAHIHRKSALKNTV